MKRKDDRLTVITYRSKGQTYSVLKNMPDSLESAVAMFGGPVVFDKFIAKVTQEARTLAQRVGPHKAQAAMDKWQIGRPMNTKFGRVSKAELIALTEKYGDEETIAKFVATLRERGSKVVGRSVSADDTRDA